MFIQKVSLIYDVKKNLKLIKSKANLFIKTKILEFKTTAKAIKQIYLNWFKPYDSFSNEEFPMTYTW